MLVQRAGWASQIRDVEPAISKSFIFTYIKIFFNMIKIYSRMLELAIQAQNDCKLLFHIPNSFNCKLTNKGIKISDIY